MLDSIKSAIKNIFSKKTYTFETVKRAYEASQPDSNFKLIPRSLSPNSATQSATEKLRDQARYLDENHDLTIGVLDTLVSKIVGKSISMTPVVKTNAGELDLEVNSQIGKLWKKFEERPDVTGQMSMASCDRLLCRTWLRDGEVLCRKIYGNVPGLEHSTDVPLSIELIEPDYLPFSKNEKTADGNIIQGIGLSRWGAPVSYHILKDNPYQMLPYQMAGDTGTFKVDAGDISHLLFTRRISQIRGVSILHGIIRRMESIKDYEESEEIAARVAANMTGFIKKDIELGGGMNEGERDLEMSAGMIYELDAGEDVGMISSDRPNSGLLDFRNAMLRGVASGTMTNFSAISGYYDGSYSSQRQELVESKVNYDILRDTFISKIKKPIFTKFIEMALISGLIETTAETDLDTITDVEASNIPIAWIDPKKEMDSFATAKNEKLNSRHGVMRLMGLDPVTVDAEIEKDSLSKIDEEKQDQVEDQQAEKDDMDEKTKNEDGDGGEDE